MLFILLNILCIIIVFFIGADVFSLADEIAYCKKNDIAVLKRKYSTCRECGHRLRVKDTFPVVSRFVNKGKCRFCDAPIGKRGFFTEIAGGILAVLSYSILYYIDKMSVFTAALLMIAIVIICMLVVSGIYIKLEKKNIKEMSANKEKIKENNKEKNKEKNKENNKENKENKKD